MFLHKYYCYPCSQFNLEQHKSIIFDRGPLICPPPLSGQYLPISKKSHVGQVNSLAATCPLPPFWLLLYYLGLFDPDYSSPCTLTLFILLSLFLLSLTFSIFHLLYLIVCLASTPLSTLAPNQKG